MKYLCRGCGTEYAYRFWWFKRPVCPQCGVGQNTFAGIPAAVFRLGVILLGLAGMVWAYYRHPRLTAHSWVPLVNAIAVLLLSQVAEFGALVLHNRVVRKKWKDGVK